MFSVGCFSDYSEDFQKNSIWISYLRDCCLLENYSTKFSSECVAQTMRSRLKVNVRLFKLKNLLKTNFDLLMFSRLHFTEN